MKAKVANMTIQHFILIKAQAKYFSVDGIMSPKGSEVVSILLFWEFSGAGLLDSAIDFGISIDKYFDIFNIKRKSI